MHHERLLNSLLLHRSLALLSCSASLQVLENVRKEVEKCECLQGVQFTHSISGGAGSGLTGLLLKTLYDYLDKGSKCILQSFTVVPSPGLTDVILEPYYCDFR